MGLGVLDQSYLERVPGTVFLNRDGVRGPGDPDEVLQSTELALGLKHENMIVLVPQPSDFADDPLNWPRWKKELFMLTFAFAMGCVGCVGPLLSTAAVPLAKEWETTISEFVRDYNSVYLGGVAISSIVNIAFAVKYGKRPVLLVNSLLLAIGNFWGAAAQSLPSMAVSRFVAGWGIGCWQSLIPANIADVWFVHQRGFRLAIFNLGLIGGLNLVLPISAVIITNFGWRTVNYGMGGAFVLVALMVLSFMPETTYIRSQNLELDINSRDDLPLPAKGAVSEHLESPDASEKIESQSNSGQVENKEMRANISPWTQYRLRSGICYDDANLFMIMLRPFKMALSPAVAWGAIIYSSGIAWQVVLGVTVSQIFSAPPYNFTIIQVGLTKLAAFVGSIIGAGIAHPLSDGVAVYMAKLNRGVYEPEFRLPLVASFQIFTATGFYVWGKSAQSNDPWPIPVVVGLGFIALGVQLSCTAATAYVIDCHREHPLETFAFLSFLKCVFAIFFTLFVSNWIIAKGVGNVFYTLGGVTTGLTLTAIPMYMFGKRLRVWYHKRLALRSGVARLDHQQGSEERFGAQQA